MPVRQAFKQRQGTAAARPVPRGAAAYKRRKPADPHSCCIAIRISHMARSSSQGRGAWWMAVPAQACVAASTRRRRACCGPPGGPSSGGRAVAGRICEPSWGFKWPVRYHGLPAEPLQAARVCLRGRFHVGRPLVLLILQGRSRHRPQEGNPGALLGSGMVLTGRLPAATAAAALLLAAASLSIVAAARPATPAKYDDW